jgi:predicted component of type VI protein secretion system
MSKDNKKPKNSQFVNDVLALLEPLSIHIPANADWKTISQLSAADVVRASTPNAVDVRSNINKAIDVILNTQATENAVLQTQQAAAQSIINAS